MLNSVLKKKDMRAVSSKEIMTPFKLAKETGAPDAVCSIFRSAYESSEGDHSLAVSLGWAAVHAARWFKNKDGKWVQRKLADKEPSKDPVKDPSKHQNFQNRRETPPDPIDGHVHEAAFDEDGNGGTSEAGKVPHVHTVFGFKVQPYYRYDEGVEYVSVHPGSLAFEEDCEECPDLKKCMEEGASEAECRERARAYAEAIEMEIFRAGTHNKMEFDEADLEEMASNFHVLKGELRPKLKITHRESQEKIAGLASYGDVVDVFTRAGEDGKKRLFAKVANVPQEVRAWIKDRRFPERSIELYPEFELGTEENPKTYKNVLKAIALLGAEMPAVTGMAPVLLEECIECQGTVCVRIFSKKDSDESVQVPDEIRVAFEALETSVNHIS